MEIYHDIFSLPKIIEFENHMFVYAINSDCHILEVFHPWELLPGQFVILFNNIEY